MNAQLLQENRFAQLEPFQQGIKSLVRHVLLLLIMIKRVNHLVHNAQPDINAQLPQVPLKHVNIHKNILHWVK
jgi:hypothetical protein